MVTKVLKIAALLMMCLFVSDASARGRIFWLESYHEGYPWTDLLGGIITETLKGNDLEYKVFHMDTKRNGSEESIRKSARQAVDEITAFKPDVIIASDDDASKYVVMPFFKNGEIPVVFCGVNHSAERYGYPYRNVTGILEMDPVDRLIFSISRFRSIAKVGYLTEDGTTARVNGQFYKTQTRFDCKGYYVQNFQEWQDSFRRAQSEVDVLILGPTSGIKSWSDDKALEFVMKEAKIPTGCLQDYLTKFALIGCLKSPEEQGQWAAGTALKILAGTPVTSIPIAKPQEFKLIINMKIAKANGIKVPKSYIDRADLIIR